MSLTLETANDVLKLDYKGPLREQLNHTTFLLSQIESNTDDIVGKHAVVPIHTSRTSGVGARAEGGTLPTAGNQGYNDVRVPLRRNYGRIQISGPTIQAMSSDRGAFVRAVESETQGAVTDLKRDVNRQVHGTSNGVIATAGTTTTSNTLQLLASATSRTQLRQAWNQGGMVIDIGTVANPTAVASARTVTAVDYDNATLTISGAAVSTTSGTHFIFRHGNGGASDNSGNPGGQDGQYELTGLQSIVSATADIQTITTSSVPVWQSSVFGNGGTNRSLSENLVNRAIQDTEIESGEQIRLLLSNAPVNRAAASLLTATRRNVDNVALEAGYSGIKWTALAEGMRQSGGDVALVWDQDCKENTLYGLCTDKLVQYVGSDWDWMDQDGAVLSRVANQDAYEATLYKYHELATTKRNAHFRIDDISHVD